MIYGTFLLLFQEGKEFLYGMGVTGLQRDSNRGFGMSCNIIYVDILGMEKLLLIFEKVYQTEVKVFG